MNVIDERSQISKYPKFGTHATRSFKKKYTRSIELRNKNRYSSSSARRKRSTGHICVKPGKTEAHERCVRHDYVGTYHEIQSTEYEVWIQ